ncbi:MAG: hypothetical protein PHE24_06330 [Patescibacteria group bacterium]|nr:hypothetical protein [Patescibacteria group bacterium]
MPVEELTRIPEARIRWYYENFNFLPENFPIPEDFKEFCLKVRQTREMLKQLKNKNRGFFLNLHNDQTSFDQLSEDFWDPNLVLNAAVYFYREIHETKIAVMLVERIFRPAEKFLK